jgi:sterol desaturase/sphingolipid hydroxylase (fatty acid hydroxylase superfamily)
MDWLSVLVTTAELTAIIAARYLVIAGAVHWGFWRKGRADGPGRLNRDDPRSAVMQHELKLSLISSPIYALPAALAYEAWKMGGTAVYLDVARYGWPWLIASGVIYLVVQDTYYYWLHRAMHIPGVFRFVHAGHHRSRQPTAFASFSFDILEAALSAWLLPALVFFVPIHPAVILVLLTVMTIAAVLNHCGWEIWPERFIHGPVGRWFITATHHARHHTHLKTNYGLYFRFWDKVMGTDVMPAPAPRKLAA